MRVYIEKFGGYIVDNPNIDFERCDGRVFSYDEVNTSGFTNGSETLTINGGQGAFPLAYLDTTKTLEFTFDISNFDMEMFEMANAGGLEEGDFGTLETALFDVDASHKITIPYECQAGSIRITGLEEATAEGATASAGKFVVTVTKGTVTSGQTAGTAGKTEITLDQGDYETGKAVRVSYKRRMVNAAKMTVKTNSTTAKGALYAHYPVYSAGSDCTESSVKAWVHVFIPRVRVTALPGMSSSYKSASTYSVTFSGIDPKRADKKMWDIFYEPTDENGEIVKIPTKADAEWN